MRECVVDRIYVRSAKMSKNHGSSLYILWITIGQRFEQTFTGLTSNGEHFIDGGRGGFLGAKNFILNVILA